VAASSRQGAVSKLAVAKAPDHNSAICVYLASSPASGSLVWGGLSFLEIANFSDWGIFGFSLR